MSPSGRPSQPRRRPAPCAWAAARLLATAPLLIAAQLGVASERPPVGAPARAESAAHGPGAASAGSAVGSASAASVAPAPVVLRDQAYGPHVRQRLDVYLPAAAQPPVRPRTVFVMVHGGAWTAGDKCCVGLLRHLARWQSQGHVVVVLNYRLVPEVTPLQQAQDVARALAWVGAHAPDWGADPQRQVWMGHSAGAHLVALVASSAALRQAQQPPLPPWLGTVLLDGGALDVERLMRGPHDGIYDTAFGRGAASWAAVSPAAALTGPTAPVWAACAAHRCSQAQAYVERVRAVGGAGAQAQWLSLPLSHVDFDTQLGAPGDYTEQLERFLRRIGAL